jgi:teichuronic acid biosynthesis glycosyltransferase TuaH
MNLSNQHLVELNAKHSGAGGAQVRPVVFFTLFATDNPYSSISLSMAKELAKETRVLYVNPPYTLKDIFTAKRKGDPMLKSRLWNMLLGRNTYESLASIPNNFIAVQSPAIIPINWLPAGFIYDTLHSINDTRVRNSIRKAIKKHRFTDFLYINCYNPHYGQAWSKQEGAHTSIYHCIDDSSQDPYLAAHGAQHEYEAAAAADITFVTSTNLHHIMSPHAQKVYHYFNAADVAVFERVRTQKMERPKELEGYTGPVIGFTGNLDSLRVDYPLIKKAALAHPDKTFLMVGPINNTECASLGLLDMPNVIFTGSKKLDELPQYLQYMDVALIPFAYNQLTKSIYPLKINEYLTAGKPVLATSFSEDIKTFGNVITLATDHDDFVSKIDIALADSSQERAEARIAVAQTNSWEARIAQLWEIVADWDKLKK